MDDIQAGVVFRGEGLSTVGALFAPPRIRDPLRQINESSNTNRMHTRWFTYLQRFNFSIQHKAGVKNKVVDALSQRKHILTVLHTTVTAFEELKKSYK